MPCRPPGRIVKHPVRHGEELRRELSCHATVLGILEPD